MAASQSPAMSSLVVPRVKPSKIRRWKTLGFVGLFSVLSFAAGPGTAPL